MNIMKKNVLLITMILFAFSSVSAQSILKKVGDAAKKVTRTEQQQDNKKQDNQQQAATSNESAGPVSFKIESTRIIGDRLLVSGKMQAADDLRLMLSKIEAISPDGDTYESKDMWFGGQRTSAMSFDNKLTADINYTVDIAIEIKGKKVNSLALLKIDAFNHTTQKRFSISLKDITIPNPVDLNLENESVIEISKDVYLKWTKVEETNSSFKLSFITENKGSKDQIIQFRSYGNIKIIDNEGSSYEAEMTLKDNVTFPAETPIAGSITLNKPLKISQIALIEFSSKYFNYKIKNIKVPE